MESLFSAREAKDIFRASVFESADKVFQRMCLTTRSKAGFLITAPLTTVKHSDQLPSLEYELMFWVLLTLLYGAKRQRSSVDTRLRKHTRSRALSHYGEEITHMVVGIRTRFTGPKN